MKVHTLSCGNCGASLDIEEGIRFITCKFCESRLEIEESDSTRYTKVIHELKEDKKKMAGDMELLHLERKLTEMDNLWEKTKEQYTDLNNREPSSTEAVLSGIIGVGTGIMCIVLSAGTNKKEILYAGFGLIIFSIVLAILHFKQTVKLESKRKSYQHSRERLLTQTKELRIKLRGDKT